MADGLFKGRTAVVTGGYFRCASQADAARAAGHDCGAALEQTVCHGFLPNP